MRWPGLLLGLCLGLGIGATVSAGPPRDVLDDPRAEEARPGATLRDRDFGVHSNRFGLERRVEMYQWRRTDEGMRPVWNPAPIDSSGFPPAYRNPARLPIESERWWADDATLAGRPIHREVLATLGRWVEFRPDFARLPANLAATFQPEGNGLGSSENPLEPGIGDLRVRWRELVLPDLTGRVELREGTWRLTPDTVEQVVAPAEPLVVIEPPDPRVLRERWSWLAGGAAVVLVLGFVVRRRSGRRDD